MVQVEFPNADGRYKQAEIRVEAVMSATECCRGEALNDDKRLARISHKVNQQTSAWNSTRCKYCSFQDPESRTGRQAIGSHEHSVLALIVLAKSRNANASIYPGGLCCAEIERDR